MSRTWKDRKKTKKNAKEFKKLARKLRKQDMGKRQTERYIAAQARVNSTLGAVAR